MKRWAAFLSLYHFPSARACEHDHDNNGNTNNIRALRGGFDAHFEEHVARQAQNQFGCDQVDTTDVCYSKTGNKCLEAVDPEMVCMSQNNNPCIGPAPTCEQIREVDELWGVDNGNLCNDGWWMAPEPGSAFPISIAGGVDHNNGDSPEENTHWHPFCMTIDGVERIRTVETAELGLGPYDASNTAPIWRGTSSRVCGIGVGIVG